MLSKSLRAAATALLLTTATVAAVSISTLAPAEAAARAPVARALQTAIREAGAGNYGAARSAVSQAESVGGLTAGDHAAIDQVKQYIAAKSGGAGGRGGLISDYNAGHYAAVIAAGRKGGLDAQSMQLVAQSYYLTRDFRGCTSYIRQNFGSGAGESILQMQQRCAFESGDNEGQRAALELLVQRSNKPEYWNQLLETAAGTKGLSDHGTLDIYRLKLLTNTLTKKDDYTLLAQLALQLGFAQEASNVVQKGVAAKLLTDDRSTRLLNMANGQAKANAGAFGRTQATGNGDALVKLGEDAWGQGHYPDALKLIQAGIAKGVSDKDSAQIRLGVAYMSAGQKDQAIRAFHGVNDPKQKIVAHLWEIYARTH